MAKKKTTQKSVLGVGLASAALGALGAYFLYGTNKGSKDRKTVKGWMLKAKGEVLHEVEKLKAVDEKQYNAIAKKVLAKYKKLKSVGTGELKTLTSDIDKAWRKIAKEATTMKTKKKPVKKKTAAKRRKTTKKK